MKTYIIQAWNQQGHNIKAKYQADDISHALEQFFDDPAPFKTAESEVICDGCGKVIPVMHPTALFVTLRGPTIGHKKLDCHDFYCLSIDLS